MDVAAEFEKARRAREAKFAPKWAALYRKINGYPEVTEPEPFVPSNAMEAWGYLGAAFADAINEMARSLTVGQQAYRAGRPVR